MPETDLIISCPICGPRVVKVHINGLFIDEDCRDFARRVISEEHAASHQAEKESGNGD